MTSADPFGPLFATDPVDDTAARLAASPPPGSPPTPTLATPITGELVADEDPLKALFGLQTEEHEAVVPDPIVLPPEPVYAAPAPELPGAPAYPEAFASAPIAPVAPMYTPEPAFTSEPTYPAAELAYTPAASPPAAAAPAGPVPPDDDPNAGTQFFGGGLGEWEEPPNLDRTTVFERVAFVLAFLVPPAGLISSIVAAVRSSHVRGWVHRFVRVSIGISVITSIAAGIAGAYFYGVLEDARKHDAVTAASTQFCTTVADNPDMLSQPTFGFPAPAASVPDTLAAIQEFVDRWDALAKVSPSGIRTDVTRVADAARTILDTITTTRLVNNEENVAVMSSVAQQSNIVGWAQEYCE